MSNIQRAILESFSRWRLHSFHSCESRLKAIGVIGVRDTPNNIKALADALTSYGIVRAAAADALRKFAWTSQEDAQRTFLYVCEQVAALPEDPAFEIFDFFEVVLNRFQQYSDVGDRMVCARALARLARVARIKNNTQVLVPFLPAIITEYRRCHDNATLEFCEVLRAAGAIDTLVLDERLAFKALDSFLSGWSLHPLWFDNPSCAAELFRAIQEHGASFSSRRQIIDVYEQAARLSGDFIVNVEKLSHEEARTHRCYSCAHGDSNCCDSECGRTYYVTVHDGYEIVPMRRM